MELKLRQPFDRDCPEFDIEQVDRLRDKREFSNFLEWTVYQAKVYYEGLGDVQEASRLLEEGLKAAPENADLLACLAECYSRLPDGLEVARDFCMRSLGLEDKADYAHTILARVQLALGMPMEAYRSAMTALQINSRNFEAGVYLGIVGFEIAFAEKDAEEMARSIKNLRLTLTLNPGSQRLQRMIAEKECRLRETL